MFSYARDMSAQSDDPARKKAFNDIANAFEAIVPRLQVRVYACVSVCARVCVCELAPACVCFECMRAFVYESLFACVCGVWSVCVCTQEKCLQVCACVRVCICTWCVRVCHMLVRVHACVKVCACICIHLNWHIFFLLTYLFLCARR